MPHSPDDAVIATYYIETNQSLDAVARAIAETETTGRRRAVHTIALKVA